MPRKATLFQGTTARHVEFTAAAGDAGGWRCVLVVVAAPPPPRPLEKQATATAPLHTATVDLGRLR